MTNVLIAKFLIIFVVGCSPNKKNIEYVSPIYSPLPQNIVKPNPEPVIDSNNFIKWGHAIILIGQLRTWGISERNRANACVNIYQKTILNK